MGWLLAVCIIFLITMFIPDSLTFKYDEVNYLYACVFAQFGVGILILAFKQFCSTWWEFKTFCNNI